MGVDPRSRGGDDNDGNALLTGAGRSPLTRGRHRGDAFGNQWVRSIPAHAGETLQRQAKSHRLKVDPRSRGGDAWHPVWRHTSRGRSPLTRGRPVVMPLSFHSSRSIPAHAGETVILQSALDFHEVDPRSRGGDQVAHLMGAKLKGRSPLTRGRHPGTAHPGTAHRSIPAHAGETSYALSRGNARWVDPRSRGGDSHIRACCSLSTGRSPLTRGRLLGLQQYVAGVRSIPAHAGETEAGQQ